MSIRKSAFAATLAVTLSAMPSLALEGGDESQDNENAESLYFDNHFRDVLSRQIASTQPDISYDEIAPDGSKRRMCYVGVTSDKSWQGSGFVITVNPNTIVEPCESDDEVSDTD